MFPPFFGSGWYLETSKKPQKDENFRVCPGQDSIWRVTQRRVAMGAEAGRAGP